MKRGPYYKTVSAIGHPVRTTMRSSAADNAIGGILIAAFWMMVGAVVLSPIWVPIWLVNEMYKEWHPVLATFVAVPFVISVIALYAWLYSLYAAREEVKAQPGQYDHITTVSQIKEMGSAAPEQYVAQVTQISLTADTEVVETEAIHTGEFALGREAQRDLAAYKRQIEDRIERDAPTINEYVSEERVLELKQIAATLYSEANPLPGIKDYVESELKKEDKWWVRRDIEFVSWVMFNLALYDERKASWAENYTEKKRLDNLQDSMLAAFEEALGA
jgi:hypothetical protein